MGTEGWAPHGHPPELLFKRPAVVHGTLRFGINYRCKKEDDNFLYRSVLIEYMRLKTGCFEAVVPCLTFRDLFTMFAVSFVLSALKNVA